jgi:ribonuclease P/MRP protein subunit POP5
MDRPQMLSPNLRERRRYMAFQVLCKTDIPPSDIAGAIWHSILNFLGEMGTAQAEVWLVKSVYDEKNRMGLIRCGHTAVEHVRAALALVSRIGDVPVTIKVIGISGTISAARKKYFGEVQPAGEEA